MGRIQADTGLVTGIKIAETVNQLIALAGQPRDAATARLKLVKDQQTAVADLTGAVIAIQLASKQLGKAELFSATTVASANTSLLSATIAPDGTPAPGTYQFTPVRLAQSQHVLSQGVTSKTMALGVGTFTIRDGGSLSSPVALSTLNGGTGVERGKLRITDRSGATAVIDLRNAQTIDDVLKAINASEAINVTATTIGDRIQLTDNTGQTAANLKVQEVGTGTTAADLGLSSIDVAANSATGGDVVRLFDALSLSQLNDGEGVSFNSALADLQITFRDGSTALDVDFTGDKSNLGDVLEALNAADPTRLQAQLSASGDRIELIDLTTGGGNFAVASLFGGSTAEDLGLAASTTGGTISGKRVLSGLNTTLLSSLKGGQGFGALGDIDLTDRSGATATVNLAAVETVDEVLSAINAAGVGIRAEISSSRNGIRLIDTTGATTSNLIVANGDGTNSATALGLTVNAAASEKQSGDLHRQIVSRQTLLSDFNHGTGVRLGSVQITDSSGTSSALNFATLAVKTVGEVIDAINNLTIGVDARINDTGDGILLTDTAGGSSKLTVADVGNGKSFADLKLAGEATGTTIDGSSTIKIELDADDTLEDLQSKINSAGSGLTASIFNDGSATPFHLSLLNGKTGAASAYVIDGSGVGLSFTEIAAAQDALVAVGPPGSTLLVSSASNVIDDAIAGIRVTLSGVSDQPVSVTVQQNVAGIVSRVKGVVDFYNKLVEKLDKYDSFNADTNAKGLLFGSSEVRRVRSDLTRLLSGRFTGSDIPSLESLGVGFDDTGKLEFDEAKFNDVYASKPEAVEEFFTNETTGFSKRLDDVVESLAGVENSALINRTVALQSRSDDLAARIDTLTARLDRQKERLLNQFYSLEATISKIQNAFGSVQNSLANAVSMSQSFNSQ